MRFYFGNPRAPSSRAACRRRRHKLCCRSRERIATRARCARGLCCRAERRSRPHVATPLAVARSHADSRKEEAFLFFRTLPHASFTPASRGRRARSARWRGGACGRETRAIATAANARRKGGGGDCCRCYRCFIVCSRRRPPTRVVASSSRRPPPWTGGVWRRRGGGGGCVVIVVVVVCHRCFVVCSPRRSSLDRGQRGATRPSAATHRYLGREVLVLARPAELGHDRDVERVLHEVAAHPPARLERARDGLRPHRHHGDAVAVAHAVRDRARDRRRDRRAWRSAGGRRRRAFTTESSQDLAASQHDGVTTVSSRDPHFAR